MTAGHGILRTGTFWSFFTVSTLCGIANAASTPVLPHYLTDTLGAGSATAGLVISLAAFASIGVMPVVGLLADHSGYRLVVMTGLTVSVAGLVMLALWPSLAGAATGRLVFGLGNAAATSLVMTWLVTIAPPGERGRALSVYGVSVWVGLALGPVFGETVNARFGIESGIVAVFVACAALSLACLPLIAAVGEPVRAAAGSRAGTAPGGLGGAVRAVALPGLVAAIAWSGEGLLVSYLAVHLQSRGLPATGLTGATTVYAAFAVSVVTARLAIGGLPDRLGARPTAALALLPLAAGLAVIAAAGDFATATAGAVLVGIGFSPLYPALTMLANHRLVEGNRGTGLGVFSAFTSIGYGVGPLLGGVLIGLSGSGTAFAATAALQLAALAVLLVGRGGNIGHR